MPNARRLINSLRRLTGSAAALLAAFICVASISPAQAGILITIDKAIQQMTVEVDGATRWVWPVSTGRRGYDTPSGDFKPFRLEEDHYSKEWDDAPMPHSIFFTPIGHAIHGSYETRNLGRRASHGCVRIAPQNAEKLFNLVKRQGLDSARVVVRGDSDAPIMSRRQAPTPQKTQQARRPLPPAAVSASPAGPAVTPSIPEQAYGYAPAPQTTDVPGAVRVGPPLLIRPDSN